MIIFACILGAALLLGCLLCIYVKCWKKRASAQENAGQKPFGGTATSLSAGRCNCFKRLRGNRSQGAAVAANTFASKNNDEEQLLDRKAQLKREEIAAARLKNLVKKDTTNDDK
jgi:hypothetical protein